MDKDINKAELGSLALRSARFIFFIDLLQKVSGPLLAVIFAQFLTPEEFGLLGIASLVLAFGIIFLQSGISDAIIQKKSSDASIYVGFWLSISIGVCLYCIVWLAAPLISQLFHQPASQGLIRILSLQLIILPFGTMPIALLKRNFEFNKVLISQFCAAIIPFIVSIPMFYFGYGYWSVVAGTLSGSLLYVLLVWQQSRYVPKLIFSVPHIVHLLRFGGFVMLESLLGWFLIYFDNAVVGAVLGSTALGMYSLAYSLTNAAIGLPVGALAGVALSTFSRLQDDLPALRQMYIRGTKLVALYAIPVSVSLALLSQPLTRIFFNEDWEGMDSLMAILALYAGCAHLWILNSHIFRAIGRPQIIIQIYAPLLLITIPTFLISVSYGLIVFAIMRSVVVIIVGGIFHTIYAVRLLGLRGSYVWHCCKLPLFATIVLALCLTGLNQITWNTSLYLSLLIKILAGIAAYLAGLYVFDRSFVTRLLRGARRLQIS